MLRRLLLLLVIAGGAFVVWRLRRFLKARTLPSVPAAWRLQAATAPALAQGLDLRDRLARTVQKHDRAAQRALLLDVDAILAEVAELERVRVEVEGHLEDLPPASANALNSNAFSAVEAQREETRAALERRIQHHTHQAARIVADLQQVYLELLETHDAGRSGGEAAARKTRALIDDLRQQTSAQKEIARFLDPE